MAFDYSYLNQHTKSFGKFGQGTTFVAAMKEYLRQTQGGIVWYTNNPNPDNALGQIENQGRQSPAVVNAQGATQKETNKNKIIALAAFVDGQLTQLIQQGGQTITTPQGEKSRIEAVFTNLGPYDPIPLLRTVQAANNVFYQQQFLTCHVAVYIGKFLEAITAYKDAVPHSTRIAHVFGQVVGPINSFLANQFPNPDLAANAPVKRFDLDASIAGQRSLNGYVEWWSKQRVKTREHINDGLKIGQGDDGPGQVPPNYASANPTVALRRYGSAAEAQNIRQKNGLYQGGRSFEGYKWFLDLAIEGATTSVTQNDHYFDIHVPKKVMTTLQTYKAIYDKDDQPTITHKPDMGGEKGCFGVHEDVLAVFNTLITKIEIYQPGRPPRLVATVRPGN